nr:unnamed protein product [Callosobruchus chinensis]
MNAATAVKCFCLVFSLIILLATVSSAPFSDYDNNIHDLYEMLMQRDSSLEDRLGHQMARRGGRGPQLRLRFGKRPDVGFESMAGERRPSLRLRFGKRSEDESVPAYMEGIAEAGEK